jgi:hypothetical protein
MSQGTEERVRKSGDVSGCALRGDARFLSGLTTRNARLEYRVPLVEKTTILGKQ